MGLGARPFADGVDVIYYIGQENYPVEYVERDFPLRVERYAVRPDSGGPGVYRGGTGVIRDVRVLCERAELATRMENTLVAPYGVAGGRAGRTGRVVLNPDTPSERVLPGEGDGIVLERSDLLLHRARWRPARLLDGRPGAAAGEDGQLDDPSGVRPLKDEQLAHTFGWDKTLGAAAFLSGGVTPAGPVRFTVNEYLVLGELPAGISARVEALVTALGKADIRAEAVPQVRTVEWSKYPLFMSWMAPAVLTRLPSYKFQTHPDTAAVVALLVQETSRLAEKLGIPLEDREPMPIKTLCTATLSEAVTAIRRYLAGNGFCGTPAAL